MTIRKFTICDGDLRACSNDVCGRLFSFDVHDDTQSTFDQFANQTIYYLQCPHCGCTNTVHVTKEGDEP